MGFYGCSASNVLATTGVGLVQFIWTNRFQNIYIAAVEVFGLETAPSPMSLALVKTDNDGSGFSINAHPLVKFDRDSRTEPAGGSTLSDWSVSPTYQLGAGLDVATVALDCDGGLGEFRPRRSQRPLVSTREAYPFLLLVPVSGAPRRVSWNVVVEYK